MLGWLNREKVDHPLANPKAARQIIGAFSYRDPCRTLEEANRWLASINETVGFKLQRRLELIDMLDTATRKSQEQLADLYIPLPEGNIQEKRLWQAASDFWKLLGDGYLACARRSRDVNELPVEYRAQLPRLATRGIRALRGQIKWTLMRYATPRLEIWGECGRFAAIAESVNAAADPIELFEVSNVISSPNQELLRLVMFWTAMPSSLSPVEQDIAERLVAHLTPRFRTSTQAVDGYDYFFDLDGSRPPLRYVSSVSVSATTRYFDAGDSRVELRKLYALASSAGSLPSEVNWGPAGESNVILRVLKHLWVNWAKESPSRAASRQKSDIRLNSVYGLQSVVGLLSPADAQGLAAASALLSDTWVAQDMSPGGCGVIVPYGKGEGLRVGMLVALREQVDASWSVGIIRRVLGHNYRQYHIGIQFVSRAALPIYLRTVAGARQGRKHECGILLNAQPTPSGSLHMVMRRDLFSGREPVEATFGQPEQTLTLGPGGVVESGHDFDWLQYKSPVPF